MGSGSGWWELWGGKTGLARGFPRPLFLKNSPAPPRRRRRRFHTQRMVLEPRFQRLISTSSITGQMSRTKIIYRVAATMRARYQMVRGGRATKSTEMTAIAVSREGEGHQLLCPPTPPCFFRHLPPYILQTSPYILHTAPLTQKVPPHTPYDFSAP